MLHVIHELYGDMGTCRCPPNLGCSASRGDMGTCRCPPNLGCSASRGDMGTCRCPPNLGCSASRDLQTFNIFWSAAGSNLKKTAAVLLQFKKQFQILLHFRI